MSKEPQVPLWGLIRKNHFGELADIKELMEEQDDTMEAQNDVQEDDNVSFANDIWYCWLILRFPWKWCLILQIVDEL